MARHHAKEQDFELNIASIIDCFTVLITYLLVSTSFISISFLDVSVISDAVSSEVPPSPTNTPTLVIKVAMRAGGALAIETTGPLQSSVEVPPKDGTFDFETMKTKLSDLKAKYPETQGATVAARAADIYRDVVKVVESVRGVLPGVSLGDVANEVAKHAKTI